MASEDPKAEGLAPRPSRTPPTLDLKAEEVAVTPVSGADPAPADAAVSPEMAPAFTSDSSGGAEASSDTAERPEDATPRSAEQAAEEELPPPAAPAAKGSGAGGIVGGLFAGAIAGAATAGGLWYALPLLIPPPAPKPVAVAPAPAPVDLAPLTARIAALEARPSADPAAIARLSERLDRTEAALKSADAAIAALKATPAPAPAAPALPAALTKSVDELKTGADAARDALAGIKRDLDALRTAQSGAQAQAAAANTTAQRADVQMQTLATQVQGLATRVEVLGPRLDAVGPRLDALKKQMDDTAAAATAFNRAAAGMVVLGTLREAVVSGRPFPAELAAARVVLGPSATALDPLAAAAAQGYPPPARLASRLAEEGAKALGAEAPAPGPQPEGIVNRLISSAESLVKVRPASGPGSVDSAAVLDRAVAQVKAGQMEDALATLKQLPPGVSVRLAAVRGELEARAAAVRATASLYQQSLAAISGKMP